ncbi:MAG: hypothetical protein WD176_09700 [Pirellulales bacterium]
MNRIFFVFATFAVVFIVATLIIGLSLGEINLQASPETLIWARVHRLAGIFSAVAVVFVDSIVVTYFIGTSRWVKEVAEAYKLDRSFIVRSTLLKRRTFPYALISMLTVVGVIALGGAADPAAALRLQPIAGVTWSQLHLGGAIGGLFLIAWLFFLQWSSLLENQQIIQDVTAEVRRIRLEKGLEV